MCLAGGHLVSLDVSWNGLEDGVAALAGAMHRGGGAPLKSLNLAGTRPNDQVRPGGMFLHCLGCVEMAPLFQAGVSQVEGLIRTS